MPRVNPFTRRWAKYRNGSARVVYAVALAVRLERDIGRLLPLLEESNHLTEEVVGWTGSRDELRALVADVVGISDYCRRVLAGEQDTAPVEALQHIRFTTAAALERVATVDITTTRGEGI